jgi:hypothetical protein
MVDSFSPDAFYGSAREFALSALEAHHAGNRRRVPLDAGTALEHLAKACLARRSPALLAEFKNESSVDSLIWLLRIDGAGVAPKVRTVGLADALARMERFGVKRKAKEDLQTLVDLRNGIVHAAEDVEVEERILAAFVQHADALIADLGRDRGDFWSGRLSVVDALLADAGDKVAHRVAFRIAAAKARIERRIASEGEQVLQPLRTLSEPAILAADQRPEECPVCEAYGIATGEHVVHLLVGDRHKDTLDLAYVSARVWFSAGGFKCQVCGLHMESGDEMECASMDTEWIVEDADWRQYPVEDDGDPAYERSRDP